MQTAQGPAAEGHAAALSRWQRVPGQRLRDAAARAARPRCGGKTRLPSVCPHEAAAQPAVGGGRRATRSPGATAPAPPAWVLGHPLGSHSPSSETPRSVHVLKVKGSPQSVTRPHTTWTDLGTRAAGRGKPDPQARTAGAHSCDMPRVGSEGTRPGAGCQALDAGGRGRHLGGENILESEMVMLG